MSAPHFSLGLRGRSLLSLVALPAFLLLSPPLQAEDPASSPRRPQAWSFEVVSGPSFGGPSGDLEAAMRRSGFDDTISWNWFGGGATAYPHTYDETWEPDSYWGAARRRIGTGHWHVGLGGGTTDFGTVSGFREKVDGIYAGSFIEAQSRIAALAPMAWYEPVRALRLGAGPAIYRVDLEVGHAGLSTGSGQTLSWNLGFVLEAALTVPVDTPVFFAALVQYRFAGNATAGPWETTTYNGARVEFPAASISVSHGFVALGIGGRF